jgi:enoyl-CoA hydratase
LLETSDNIATLTFNRPDVMNALNRETMGELEAVVAQVKNDPGAKVLILTGAGEKAFVAGADIKMLAEQNPASARELARYGQRVLRELETMGKPAIAAVNGFALGGGCEVAQACTIRYASETARFGQPEINLGLMPGYGGTQRLPRLVGLGRALEINLTGEMISAAEALRIGLVNKVVPGDQLMAEARSLAEKIAAKSAPVVALILQAANAGVHGPLEAGLAMEADLFGMANTLADSKEGLSAFLEKRAPKFEDW